MATKRTQKRKTSSRGVSARGKTRAKTRGASAHPIIGHDKIRAWVEERGGHPASVTRTRGGRGKDDPGSIRIDFPGYSGARSLEPIDWDEWFEKFDQSGLALMVQGASKSRSRRRKSSR